MRRFVDRWRERALVYALWMLGMAGAALMFSDTLHSHLVNRDFVAVWAAGKLALAGRAVQTYDPTALQAFANQLVGTSSYIVYPYPPHTLFIAVPLSLLPLPLAFWTWQAISAALFYSAARSYLPAGFPKVLAILTPAALINVGFGQVGLFFGALWLFAFSGSAFAAAAMTFKPHLGLLVVGEAVRRRQLLITSAIALAILALSVVLFGVGAWRVWISEAIAHQMGDLATRSIVNWTNKMAAPFMGYGLFGWLAFAGAGIYLLFRRFDVFTAATASFLITPYGFHYDMTVVCLGFGVLLFERWRTMPPWQTFIAALAFLSPLLAGLGTLIAPPILLAGLYVQTRQPITKDAGAKLVGSKESTA